MWLLEYKADDLKAPITLVGRGILYKTNGPKAALTALVEALGRMTKESNIRIYTDCQHLINSAEWLPKWAANGWTLSNGKEVKNKELWQKAYELMDQHLITFALPDEPNEYKNYMRYEVEKEVQSALDGERDH